MLKKRIVLTLLFEDGVLVNSRQFVLNKVAEVKTLLQYLDFESIDEVVLLDVSRGKKNFQEFCTLTQEVTKKCFIPVSIGGGISSFNDAQLAFNYGGDKVVLNSLFFENIDELKQISTTYGKQSIILSLDVKKIDGEYLVFYNNGKVNSFMSLDDALLKSNEVGVGDILLRSIDCDGIGNGYDLELLNYAIKRTTTPLIIAGGVGSFNHLADGIQNGAQAVNIGNLFHFVGYKMSELKNALRSEGIDIPSMWNH